MKIAFKNFLTTLRRYKTASALNIAGLTLAFLSFYVMMVQVTYDVGYNSSFPASNRLYIVAPESWRGQHSLTSSRPAFEAAVSRCPEVEASGMVVTGEPVEVRVERDARDFDRFEVRMGKLSASAVDLLGMRAVEGDLSGVTQPDGVIVARSTARRLDVHAGDAIRTGGRSDDEEVQSEDDDAEQEQAPSPERRWIITGIYEDFADNSLLSEGRIFGALGDEGADSPSVHMTVCMFRLRKGASTENFVEMWRHENTLAVSREHAESHNRTVTEADLNRFNAEMMAVPVTGYYFDTRVRSLEHGSLSTVLTCAAIALVVVVVAFINFVNFFFALIPVRLRAVNVCKIFGASTSALRRNFLFEAMGLVLCALLLTGWISMALPETPLADYVSRSLHLGDNFAAAGLLLLIGLAMAVAAALYPSYYITSFNASLAAKGGYAGSVSGRRLRTALVGVQFTVSMVLIVVAACMWLQYRYVVRYDIGIDAEQLMSVHLTDAQSEKYGIIMERMASVAGIGAVTACHDPMVSPGSGLVLIQKYKGQEVELHARNVSSNFASVMGIPVIEGEDLKSEYDKAAMQYALVSDRTRRKYGFEVGDVISGNGRDCRIVGVAGDVLTQPLDSEQADVIYITTDWSLAQIYFRLESGSDIGRVTDDVRAILKEFDPDSDVSVEFFDAGLQRLYSKISRSASIIGLFAALAVAISLMGVFGIVLFETQYRRREIAVRRVFGASVRELVAMFNLRYAAVIAVCFAVAVPAAWYLSSQWLTAFVRRVPLSWWIFAAALAAVAAVTLGLVTWCSRRAASENPARVLGGE